MSSHDPEVRRNGIEAVEAFQRALELWNNDSDDSNERLSWLSAAESNLGNAYAQLGDAHRALARQRRTQAQGGLGGRITLSLVQGLNARIDVSSEMAGTVVTVDIPPEDSN